MIRRRPDITEDPSGFSFAEYARRHRKVREAMQSRGIDCLIVAGNTGYHHANAADLRYLSGLSGTALDGTYVLFPLSGEAIYLGPSRFMVARIGKRCAMPAEPVIFRKGTRIRDYAGDLAARIRDLALEKGTIGIVSMRVMPVDIYLNLARELPKARFVSAGDVLLECRMIKSAEELAFIRKAGECADKGIEAIVEAAQPGVTEAELIAHCDYAMIQSGADRGPFILLSSNPWEKFEGTIGDASRSRKRVGKGDIILTELSPSYGGHYVQVCVPIAVGGRVPRAFRELLNIDQEIYRMALEELRPGHTTSGIEAKIAQFASRLGKFRRAWALQSVELAEAFFKYDVKLETNMSYVIHPWTEFSSGKGFEGHTVGNTVIVTGGEPEQVNRSPLDLVRVAGRS
jgi:Xaa-Pro aminopeptidase